jgi:hypothetical protein
MLLKVTRMIFPEKVIVKLSDSAGQPLCVPNVLLRVRLIAQRKNDFLLQPFFTGPQGVATISKRELLAEVSAQQDSGLMDYGAPEDCGDVVEINALSGIDIERAVTARTGVWTSLLRGESERWSSIEELISIYRSAANGRLEAEPLRVSWDGRQSKCEYSLVCRLIER